MHGTSLEESMSLLNGTRSVQLQCMGRPVVKLGLSKIDEFDEGSKRQISQIALLLKTLMTNVSILHRGSSSGI